MNLPNWCDYISCMELVHAKKLCKYHYYQQAKGYPLSERTRVKADFCSYEGCDRKHQSKGWCASHYVQVITKGQDPRPLRKVAKMGSGHINGDGYKIIKVAGRRIAEHRYVMEQRLGRQLLPEETVHHLNGDRLDNRAENLELWSASQPRGQRVSDKIKWAEELLSLYKNCDTI